LGIEEVQAGEMMGFRRLPVLKGWEGE